MKRIVCNLLGALAVSSALNVQISAAHGEVITFTNPTPVFEGSFGRSVAAMGSDRVLIGAPHEDTGTSNTGAAYLFSTNGALLTTFANPAAEVGDEFGWSVVALGSDRVLIGAPHEDTGASDAGAAYLFSANGAMFATFTNPTPAASDYFGSSVAAVGTDRVLIGAHRDDTGATNAGAVYLFSTNGVLLTTLTNPTPEDQDFFGVAMAALGTDRLLIGAYRDNTGATNAGAAYLFSASGALLTTFTNPMPEEHDFFGSSVATVGSDRVLIGAYHDDTIAVDAGVAYLFNTNGALLTTFTNPTPSASSLFGFPVAAMGNDRVLIGALGDDAGATNAGAVHLFSTNGALVATLTNPTPAFTDYFGYSVATPGAEHVLIGAYGDDTGATNAGSAYLFNLDSFAPEAPLLSIALNPKFSTITLSWPIPTDNWMLESTNALPSSAVASWPQIPPPYETNAWGTIWVKLTNSPAAESQYFRLHKQ